MTTCTVLIVDDEPLILRALRRVLRGEDCRVLAAENAARGLEYLAEEEVDIVISDKNMPHTDGLAFLKRVKQEYPRALTIMLTGNADLGSAVSAINEAGVFKYILKPWDDGDLRFTVREALAFVRRLPGGEATPEAARSNDIGLRELEREYPGITRVERDAEGYIVG